MVSHSWYHLSSLGFINLIKDTVSSSTAYEGVSNSFKNHLKVKEPEISFLYWTNKTSLKSHYAKLHIPPTFIDCPQPEIIQQVVNLWF